VIGQLHASALLTKMKNLPLHIAKVFVLVYRDDMEHLNKVKISFPDINRKTMPHSSSPSLVSIQNTLILFIAKGILLFYLLTGLEISLF
jgi:hypothetical protein